MGCTNKPLDLSGEELLLTANENSMNYSTLNVVYADMVFRKNAPHLVLNPSQFSSSAGLLGLNLGPKVKSFYRGLQSATQTYSLNSLVITAFLLCAGTVDEKARVLFELYDDKQSEVLDAIKLRGMASDLHRVACELLPAVTNVKQLRSDERLAVQVYLAQVVYVKDLFIQKFTSSLLKSGSCITKQDFLAAYAEDWFSKTSTAYGLRSAVLNEYALAPESTKALFAKSLKKGNSAS
jgi:hypothetical protein